MHIKLLNNTEWEKSQLIIWIERAVHKVTSNRIFALYSSSWFANCLNLVVITYGEDFREMNLRPYINIVHDIFIINSLPHIKLLGE